MKTETVTITPERARHLLRKNNSNRKLSMRLVDDLVSDIENNRWQVTHQGIAITKDGVLLDGQHRLHAIIKSNTPVRIMLTTGAKHETFKVIDSGKKRSHADVLGIEGFSYFNQLPGLVYRIFAWNDKYQLSKSKVVDTDTLIAFVRANETELYDAIKAGRQHSVSWYNRSVSIFMYWLIHKINPPLDAYMDALLSGINLDSHLAAFRNKLVDMKIRKLTPDNHDLITQTLHVIKCSIRNKRFKLGEIETRTPYELKDDLIQMKMKLD